MKKYKNIITKEIDFIPTTFTKGQIIFFNGKDYVATINDANLNLILGQNSCFLGPTIFKIPQPN